jgi:hypothetical protein
MKGFMDGGFPFAESIKEDVLTFNIFAQVLVDYHL